MKIILFRSNNIFDSRVNKYKNFFDRSGQKYLIVGWDRVGKGWNKENYDFCRIRAGVDQGGIKAVLNHLKWMFFVYKYLTKHQDVTTIHACDLNVAFPAALYKILHKPSVNLIFDACDWFSSNYACNAILKYVFRLMEWFAYRKSNYLIICEPEREEQISFKLREKPLVLPNIPEITSNVITPIQDKFLFKNENLVIAYLGGFSNDRFLSELLELAKTEPFNLLIAGYGNKDIVEKCEQLSKLDNVKYFEYLPMVDGINMENAADIIYAMYCKINQNNVYAAPNKFYESLLLGKPIITTKGTIVEPKVVNNNIGWAIEENIVDLRYLINSITKEEIFEKGRNASKLWNLKYNNYLELFFTNIYSKIIR